MKTIEKYAKRTMIFKSEVTVDRLKKLGFTYRLSIWQKGNFSIQFYKYLWKCSVPGSDEFDLIYMKDLYDKYWELTGQVLPKVQDDEI